MWSRVSLSGRLLSPELWCVCTACLCSRRRATRLCMWPPRRARSPRRSCWRCTEPTPGPQTQPAKPPWTTPGLQPTFDTTLLMLESYLLGGLMKVQLNVPKDPVWGWYVPSYHVFFSTKPAKDSLPHPDFFIFLCFMWCNFLCGLNIWSALYQMWL